MALPTYTYANDTNRTASGLAPLRFPCPLAWGGALSPKPTAWAPNRPPHEQHIFGQNTERTRLVLTKKTCTSAKYSGFPAQGPLEIANKTGMSRLGLEASRRVNTAAFDILCFPSY